MKSTSRELLLFSLKWVTFCCCCWNLADGSQRPSTAAFVVPLKSSLPSSATTIAVTDTSRNHKTHGIPWVWSSLRLSKNANNDDGNPKVPAAPFFFARKMVTPLTRPIPPAAAAKEEDNCLETTPGNSVVSPMEASYESIYTAAEEISATDTSIDDAAISDNADNDNGIDNNIMEQPAEISENAEKEMDEVLSLLKDTLEEDKSQEEVMTLLGLRLEDANDEEEEQHPTNIQQGQQEIKMEELEQNVPMEESVEEIETTGEEMVSDAAEITEAEMAEELLLAGPAEGDNTDNAFRQSTSVPAFAMDDAETEGFDNEDNEISSSSFTAQEQMMMMENLPMDDGVGNKPTAGSFVENEEELTMMQDQVLGDGTPVGSTPETKYVDETEPIVAGSSERDSELARQEESGSTLSLNDLVMETSGPEEESYDYPFMPGSVMDASPILTQSSAADSGMQQSMTEVEDSLGDVGVVQDKEPFFRSMLTFRLELERKERAFKAAFRLEQERQAALAAKLVEEAKERAVREEQFARRLLASRLEQEKKERTASLAAAIEQEAKENEEAALAAVNLEQEVLMENAAGFEQETSEATLLEPAGLAVPDELKESDSSTEGLIADQQLDDGSQLSELTLDPVLSKMASQQLAKSDESFSEWDVNPDPTLQGFQQQQPAIADMNEQDSIPQPEIQQELDSPEALPEDAAAPGREIRTPGPYLGMTSEEESINTSRLSFIQPLQSEMQSKPSRGTKKIAFMNEPLGGAGDRRRGEILERAEALARESLQQSQGADTAISNLENSTESHPEEPVPKVEEATPESEDPQARNEAGESDDSNAIIREPPQQMMEQQNDQPIQPVRGMLPDQPFGRTQEHTQRFAQIRPDDTGQWW